MSSSTLNTIGLELHLKKPGRDQAAILCPQALPPRSPVSPRLAAASAGGECFPLGQRGPCAVGPGSGCVVPGGGVRGPLVILSSGSFGGTGTVMASPRICCSGSLPASEKMKCHLLL